MIARALAIAVAVVVAASSARAQDPDVHEDVDYRFKISRPGPGWSLLSEPQARTMNSEAVAGLTDGRGANFLVLVDEMPGADLDGVVVSAQANMPLEEPTFSRVEAVVFQSLPARRWTTRGRFRGMEVIYRHLAFLRGRFVYLLMGFGLVAPPNRGNDPIDLNALADHFVLTEGPVRTRRVRTGAADVRGVGWRVREGVYEDPVHSLRVRPSDGWRLIVGQDLRQNVNGSACVGLAAEDPEVYVILIVERARRVPKESLLGRVRSSFAEGPGMTRSATSRKAKVGGRDFAFDVYRRTDAVPIVFHHAARLDGDLCVQVQAWFVEALAARAIPRLASAYGAIDFLDEKATAALARELREDGDPQDVVGPRFCLRAGVYRDFEHGFTWTKPAGFWNASAGQEARALHPDATLYLQEESVGLTGLVIAELDPPAEPPGAFHARVVDRLQPRSPPGKPTTVALEGGEMLLTEVTSGEAPLGFRRVVGTVFAGGRLYQLHLWGFEGNFDAARAQVHAAVRALRFPTRLVASEPVGGGFVDHRLGYGLRKPAGEGWRFRDVTPLSLAPTASMTACEGNGRVVLAAGFSVLRDDQDERAMFDLMLGVIGRQAQASGRAPEDEELSALAGLPAVRVRLPGPGGPTVWMARRGRTFYMLVVSAAPSRAVNEGPELFELLD